MGKPFLDNTIDLDWLKKRLLPLMCVIAVVFAVLLGRLMFLQLVEGDTYYRLSSSNSIRLKDITPLRGFIYDRDGRLLVDNRPAFNLSITPKDAGNVEGVLKRLSVYTALPLEKLQDKWEASRKAPSFKPILLKQDIGRDLLAVLEARRYALPGVSVTIQPVRDYLFPGQAAHLLGYLGEIDTKELKSGRFPHLKIGEYVGKFGVERSFESILGGRRGGRQVEVNSSGQVVRTLKTVPASPGRDLYLTIDSTLQQVAEAALGEEAGAVVAINPNNGEVLALASAPTFNQNDFISGLSSKKWQALLANPQKPLTNKAIQGAYPPGSVYKIVTALAGLEEKVIYPDTTFFCPGQFKLGRRTFRCWRRGGHGTVNLKKALAESCDVYFYQVGLRLGVDKIAHYANGCGLGRSTGIELVNENSGLIPTKAWKKNRTGISWQRGETVSISIGQGFNLTTPLQMAVLTAAVANGGTLYRPTVVQDGLEQDSREDRKLGHIPAGPNSLQQVKAGLWEVVNGARGTARIAQIPGVEVCGKTGTAQVFTRKTQSRLKEEDLEKSLRSHAWFVAYAPAEKAQIAVAVLVEHGAHGSSAAAPIGRKVIATYLGIELEHHSRETDE